MPATGKTYIKDYHKDMVLNRQVGTYYLSGYLQLVHDVPMQSVFFIRFQLTDLYATGTQDVV